MKLKEKLINKWDVGLNLNNCWIQKELPFISKDARLNILFNPIDTDKYTHLFTNTDYHKLFKFYNSYNGCKLFSNSLCIYGIQSKSNDLYQTYDLELENKRISQMINTNDYVFFGSLGGQYVFGLKSNVNDENVYCIDVDNGSVVKVYEDFDLMFETIFNNLYEEYDKNGVKLNKNKDFKKIKSLYNTTIEEKFLEGK